MVDFTKVPTRVGFFAPERFEADIHDCEVIGKVPKDLNGTFFRVGGDWFYPPLFPDDAVLNADGYISAFRFKDGIVSYKGRYVRTRRYELQKAANRQLFGYYRNPFTDDPSVRDPERPYLRTVANTSPLVHAGKLFALKEDGLPHRIDPVTLDTVGPWDFEGAWKSQTFTAHPKIDPVTGEMIAFGYQATGLVTDDLFIYTIGRDGKVKHEQRIKVPYVSVVHDCAVTQKHILLPFGGYVTSMERLKAGKIHWGWDATKPSYIGVLARDGDGKDIRWFKGPERCMMHTFNAYTEGSKIILYAPFYDSNFFPFFPPIDGTPWNPQKAKAYVRRITIDLRSKKDTWTEEILWPFNVGDLGRIDTRFMTLRQRYGYTSFNDPDRPFDEARAGNLRGRVSNTYGRFDFETGKLNRYFVGPTHSLQECCFVPRPGSREEGDGYLIGVASNYAEMRSELVIADAQNLEAGDVARVILPFRSTAQVHGIWADASELA
ncbi:MAG: carotenoid oxygenase family protein [Steroidobacteraceae bacterium]|nr:carotenoid oxygenase family protein [Steroidobacteraceae bacterium]